MSIENKLKAPEGMYAVCVWDPTNPSSNPVIVGARTTGRRAIYASEKYAKWYAGLLNEQWDKRIAAEKERGFLRRGETEYFVMDDQGSRIF